MNPKNCYFIEKHLPFKPKMVQDAIFTGRYEFPVLKAPKGIPEKAIPFDKAKKTANKNQWVHFYIDDFRFEIMWSNPQKYLAILKAYEGVISTDFSLYREMPLSMQIWNTYRNRALAYWLQKNGIDVIPNVRWGDERTYDFCFDGIPKNSTVCISTNGCIQENLDRFYFKKGLAKMVEILTPDTIINYSQTPEDIFGEYRQKGIIIISIENYTRTIRKAAV